MTTTPHHPVAVLTGASQGLGRALAHALAEQGWRLVLDGRDARALEEATAALAGSGHAVVAGDVADPAHRAELVAAAEHRGGATALVNNASTLGASPLPRIADLDESTFARVLAVNLQAPHALLRALLPQLRARAGTVLNLTSDASVEPYESWGAYAASKAALDHLTRILAAEEPAIAAYAVDPGDMRTRMHQDAFPDEDISDRPDPQTVVPALAWLLAQDPASRRPGGRLRGADLIAQVAR